jgi:tetratricopeptide (TPR) repeat protein
MALRYEPAHDVLRRKPLDSAYVNAMARVYERFPDDPDVGTLYAESMMLLLPRRGTWDMHSPPVHRIHSVLEAVLSRHLEHPGACHLFVHATETTPGAGKAERCADLLGQSIPGASHINHMPSHTYNRVGRWGDAVRANIEAWHSDLRAEWGEGFAIYPSHNLHMLLFAASYDGQGAIAIQAAKDYAKISRGGQFYHALALVRFGRFDEALELRAAPEQPIFRGLWEFARGYAHLRRGSADSARAYLDRVTQAAQAIPRSENFRGHTAAQLLGIVGGILSGEVLRASGDTAAGIAALERASALEDSLRYDEPEPLNFSPKHWLGAALLEAGRTGDAERVYRAELALHPRNGWSLFGLVAALEVQGKADEAARTREEFARAWARSEVLLRASRF